MGKAAIDLPDPADQTALKANISADDLLSQLAGAEIDRLLAEADEKRADDADQDNAPQSQPAPAAAAPDSAAAPPALASDASAASTPAPPAVASSTSTTSSAASSASPEMEAQLDQLFNQLGASFDDAPPVAAQAAAPQPTAPEPAAPASASTSAATAVHSRSAAPAPTSPPPAPHYADAAAATASAADAVAAELEAAERQQNAALAAPLQEALDEPIAAVVPDSADDDRLPLLLRPLEWLNAPLAGCSESARQTIGKIALLTLFNAIAILIYVLIFRRGR